MENKSNNFKILGIVGLVAVIALAVVLVFVYRGGDDTEEPATDGDSENGQTENGNGDNGNGENGGGENGSTGEPDVPQSIIDDVDAALAALTTYAFSTDGSAPDVNGSAADLTDIFSDVSWGHYEAANVFYFAPSFDTEDSSHELAEAADSMDSSKLMIWASRRCADSPVASDGDPADGLVEGTPLTVAIMALPEGASEIACRTIG